jgi:hypothetical protein
MPFSFLMYKSSVKLQKLFFFLHFEQAFVVICFDKGASLLHEKRHSDPD